MRALKAVMYVATPASRAVSKGPQIDVAEQDLRNPCRVVVTAGFCRAIADVMFRTGGDRPGLGQRCALVSEDHGRGQHAGEIGIFAEGFGDPSPARVARDIHHGRERPTHAMGIDFTGRHARRRGRPVPGPSLPPGPEGIGKTVL